MHDFWRNEDPSERVNNMASSVKNLVLAGAALALMGVEEPWEASVAVGQRSIASRSRTMARRPGGVSFLSDAAARGTRAIETALPIAAGAGPDETSKLFVRASELCLSR